MKRSKMECEAENNDVEVKVITKEKKGWSRFKITVEPIPLIIGFTNTFTSGVTIDLIQLNACTQEYNRSFAECSYDLSPDIKAGVEAMTADVNMINNIIQGLFPVFLVLLVGPWSDTNGRKPFISWAICGYIVYYLLWGIFSFFSTIPLMVFLIPAIPLGLSGSFAVIYVCTWSAVSDNFDDDERPMRFCVIGSCITAGYVLGNASAGQVLKMGGRYGFQVVFFISLIAAIIALIYTLVCVEETVVKRKEERTKLLDLGNIKSVFVEVLFKPWKENKLTLLTLTALFLEIPLQAGDVGIVYLVGKSHFSWSLTDFNMFAASAHMISALAPVALAWLLIETLGIKNITCLIAFSVWLLIMEILKAMSANEIMFWITGFLGNTAAIIGPSLDTELSHSVSEDNLGKAFTILSLINAVGPLIAMPLYTELYKYFLPDRTLYVFFLSAILSIGILICTIGLCTNRSSYSTPPENPPDENIAITNDSAKTT